MLCSSVYGDSQPEMGMLEMEMLVDPLNYNLSMPPSFVWQTLDSEGKSAGPQYILGQILR